MPCYHPVPAYRGLDGGVTLDIRKSVPSGELLGVRCGSCLGCREARARDWTIRARFELADHSDACWCTLTYDEGWCPPTLSKRHLQLFFKRLRKRTAVRYIACGEYGERTARPHYHAILFGVPRETRDVEASWGMGFAQTHSISDASIAYVCGYVQKKLGHAERAGERVDGRTGEVYTYQPPFVLSSRRPGIGASARRHWPSWKRTAILDGAEVPAPRYLHAEWVAQASADAKRIAQREMNSIARQFDRSPERREAGESISAARRELSGRRRSL